MGGDDFATAKKLYEEEADIINKIANGSVNCVECGRLALSYCTMLQDFFCLRCFARLHQKGARRHARAYKLDVCSWCKCKAAKLQCSVTHQLFCNECFAIKHIKTLPYNQSEREPTKIVYSKLAPPKETFPERGKELDTTSVDEESIATSTTEDKSLQWVP